MAKLTFLGATGTVTGSKYLLEADGKKLLIDCGMFQGLKELRLRNWEDFPIDPSSIDAVILTHAHIDHTGYLPKLVQLGFKGTVYATPATMDLCQIMLPDSAHLQEEDAKYANKKQFTKHEPAMPLYSLTDAENALELFQPLPYGKIVDLSPGLTLCYRDAGHILGSAFVDIRVKQEDGERRILFSGDLGRPAQPILRDPHTVFGTDYLVLESTYGNRLHGETDRKEDLAKVINDSYERGGVLVIPSFAVGRTQELLYTIRELENEKRIPIMPIFVDSPMAINATNVFMKNTQDHDMESKLAKLKGIDILKTTDLRFAKTAEQSKAINNIFGKAIIISASGMVTGGRILHHLFNRLANPNNTVLFIGYQAEGTRGRTILEGAESVKIHGQQVPVKAHIEQISGFSAHADYNEILAWLSSFNEAPRKIFIVHGEASQSAALGERIQASFNWETAIPKYLETFDLD
ncbi:MBL fold metallo-hydrolase [bacterium]|nr:MBL fold metallo-hydrolase [bacterium]MBU1064860.1 MBL fold metallo-hydrolase [bacterium]MBU1634244.1 MBL fold metallo-hydrolase [bacterium]MBU1873185.1 MBL fold metallo-hydrolase [bacterium]